MKLELRLEIAVGYKSASQRARVLTETWVVDNLYCPACPCDILSQAPKGEKVIDFICEECGEPYQLKSHRHPFGNRVVNSAYQPKVDAISKGTIPNFVFRFGGYMKFAEGKFGRKVCKTCSLISACYLTRMER